MYGYHVSIATSSDVVFVFVVCSNDGDIPMNWNAICDDCTFVIDVIGDICMNAPVDRIDQIIELYLEYEEFKSKDWKTGFRQALFLALDEKEYMLFIDGITK